MLQGYSCAKFAPATCPMKFNKLNSVRHVAGANFAQISCCASEKVPEHMRLCRCSMSRKLFHKCANSAIWSCYMSLLRSPATCPVSVYLRRFCPPATFCSDMFLQHVSSCAPTFNLRGSHNYRNKTIKTSYTLHKDCEPQCCFCLFSRPSISGSASDQEYV